MTPSAPPGLLSEGEVREALARVRAFVERHPRRNESILRRLDDAVSVLAPEAAVVDAPQATLVADTTDGITDTITGTDAAVEVLDQAAEARIARTEGVTARWRLRAARDLGRDAVRALGAGVLVSQEERTSAASHTAHAHAHHGPQSHHGAPGYEQSNDRCARRNRASDGSDGGKTGQG